MTSCEWPIAANLAEARPYIVTYPRHINLTLPEWYAHRPDRMDMKGNIDEALERIDSLANQATPYERYKLCRARDILRSCMNNEAFWYEDRIAYSRERALVDFLGMYSRHQANLDVYRLDLDGYLVPNAVDSEALLEKLSDDILEEVNAIGSFLGVPREREEPWGVVMNTRAMASWQQEFGSRQHRSGSASEYGSADETDETEDSDPFSDGDENEDAVWVESGLGHRWWYM